MSSRNLGVGDVEDAVASCNASKETFAVARFFQQVHLAFEAPDAYQNAFVEVPAECPVKVNRALLCC